MFVNPLLQKIQEKEFVLGTMITEIRNPLLIPLLKESGFDFAIMDMEHSTFTHYDLLQFVMAAKHTDFTVFARPWASDYISLAKVWDSGAQGIMVPRVETVEEVRGIINASKYPPIGQRGYGARGIITDYETLSMPEKINIINSNTMIWLQIEKQIAIETIDELIAPKEIDGVIIGPHDLSLSLGQPGAFHSSEFTDALQKVVDACQTRNIPCGIHTDNLEVLKEWKSRGMRLLMYSSPINLIKDAAKSFIQKISED